MVDWPDLTVPGTWNVIAGGMAFYPAGDFLMGDFSKLYVLDYDTNNFGYLDTTSGAFTLIANAAATAGNWSGSTAAVDGTLYASSALCGTASYLHTIDPGTGTVTPVGPVTNATCVIDIAINAAGELYGVDIVNDELVQIDPGTGAGTVIGSLGVNANYAQGLDFDEVTGVLYWALTALRVSCESSTPPPAPAPSWVRSRAELRWTPLPSPASLVAPGCHGSC